MLAIGAVPIEFRTIHCRRRYESHPSMRVTKRALHRTTSSGITGFHGTFRNSSLIATNKADSIRTKPVTITIAMGGDSTAI